MKKILIIILLLLPIIILYKITGHYFRHSVDESICNKYMWIFKDKVKEDMISNPYAKCGSLVKKRDICNTFPYYHGDSIYLFGKMLSVCPKEVDFESSKSIKSGREKNIELINCFKKFEHDHNIKIDPITVWEFKDLQDIDLNKVEIKQNVDFEDMNSNSAEIFEPQGAIKTMMRYDLKFKDIMNINLDRNSKIEKFLEGRNYKGFYGSVNRIAFNDEKGKAQVIIDNSYSHAKEKDYNYVPNLFSPTMLLLYKGHGSFYVIIINSKEPFKDESMINILNLE